MTKLNSVLYIMVAMTLPFSVLSQNCDSISNIEVVANASNSLWIDWKGGGNGPWQMRYVAKGGNLNSATAFTVSSKPFRLKNLSANSYYWVQLRDSCSSTGWRSFIDTASGTTACTPINLPYSENFESATWVPNGMVNSVGKVDTCWKRETVGKRYIWKASTGQYAGYETGPRKDHTTGTGKLMNVEFRTGQQHKTDSTYLESPLVYLGNQANIELSFWYHKYGVGIGDLKILVSNNYGLSYTKVGIVGGETQDSALGPWYQKTIDLSAFVGDTIKVRFFAVKTLTTNMKMGIDDVKITQGSACKQAQEIKIESVGVNKATFSWLSAGTASWELSIGSRGFSPGSGTILSASTNPKTISNLTPNTNYQVYVRSVCGAGNKSTWWGPVGFTTQCNPTAIPYSENFDGANFAIGNAAYFINNPFPNCWDRNERFAILWNVTNGPLSYNAGPTGDHSSGNGKYLYSGNFYAPTKDWGYFTSVKLPPISTLNSSRPGLKFWYHLYGPTFDSLEVFVENGIVKERVKIYHGQQQKNKADGWKDAIIDLTNFSNDTIIITFMSNGYTVALDDIEVVNLPACVKPYDLHFVGNSSSSIVFSWTTLGATMWDVQYGSPGFTLGNGTQVTVNSNPAKIKGLSPNTSYDFYVRENCGVNGVSTWAGPIRATTTCSELQVPFLVNFDSTNFVPNNLNLIGGSIDACWTRNLDKTIFWKAVTSAGDYSMRGPLVDHTTGNGTFMVTGRLYYDKLDVFEAELLSPSLDLANLTSPQLRFYYHIYRNNKRLKVQVWDGLVWHTEDIIPGPQQLSATSPWHERLIELPHYAGDSIRVRFVAESSDLSSHVGVAIDDFEIRESPICPRPINVTVDTLITAANAVTVRWTTGGSNDWQIGYRPAGSIAPYTVVNVNSNPFTITGMQSSRNFEIVVRDSCGAGNVSFWSEPTFGKTDCGLIIPPYHESFDGTNWIEGQGQHGMYDSLDPCWRRTRSVAPFFAVISGANWTSFYGASDDALGGGKYLHTNTTAQGGTTYVMPPPFFIHPNLDKPYFKFAYHMFSQFTNRTLSLTLELDTGTGYHPVWVKNGIQQTSQSALWKYATLDLAGYRGDTLNFRFKGVSGSTGVVVAIDEVAITGVLNPCPVSTAKYSYGNQYLQVSYNSSASLQTDSVFWDFGDGTFSSAFNPIHIYNTKGTYPVALYSFNTCGDIDTLRRNVKVCDTIVPNFTYNYQNGQLILDADSTENATSYLWYHGSTFLGSLQKISGYFLTNGWKTIELRAFNQCGDTASVSKLVYVCAKRVKSNFGYTYPNNPNPGLLVRFDASSSLYGSQYNWDFGDGNTGTGLIADHLYPAGGGNYTVGLWVVDSCGNRDSVEKVISNISLPEEWLNNGFSIFPNPASQKAFVEWDSEKFEITEFVIVSSEGKEVYRSKLGANKNEHVLEFGSLPTGLYLVRAISLDHILSQKLLIDD